MSDPEPDPDPGLPLELVSRDTSRLPDFPDLLIEVDPLFARLFPENGCGASTVGAAREPV